MTRISLKEAYDNRDVIAQLVSLRDDVDELLNILKDIDPDGDLTNVVTKTGDQTIDGVKTFIGKIVANCDIIQNGAAYETHAEQLYTTKDYIVTRDGALGGLQPGEFSGFRVNKYDSVNDGHLVMDMNGVARVGDVNDEQPLATRDEAADMTSGALVKWDGVNQKLIAPNSNIGSDTKPIKIVNGEPVVVANNLALDSAVIHNSGSQYLNGTLLVKNILGLDSFDSGAGYVGVLSSKNSRTNYYCRIVIAMDDDNTCTAALQKFDQNGSFLGSTTLGTL